MSITNTQRKVLSVLKEAGGKLSSAEIGDIVWGDPRTAYHWQRYTRTAGRSLKALEAKGYVKSSISHGSTYYRTLWKLTLSGQELLDSFE